MGVPTRTSILFGAALAASALAAEEPAGEPARLATGPATPACVVIDDQAGQLDFQVSGPRAGQDTAGDRCPTRVAAVRRRPARYQAVPFASDSIGNPGSFCPSFAPDGGSVVYVRKDVGLVESRLVHGRWSEPVSLPFSGPAARDGDPFFSPDGTLLFFWSTRPSAEGGAPPPNPDLWVVDCRADGWGVPRLLPPPVNEPGGEAFPAVAADGTLYFGALRAGGRGGVDLYRARPQGNGGYATPENLGVAVNSPATELDGYVSPDQSLLVFASDRPGGEGKLDLYVSHRIVGGWATARNLGRGVNGPGDEFCPQLTPDGRWLVFGRAGGIYQVDAAVLDDATP
jgi:hypothetical protein